MNSVTQSGYPVPAFPAMRSLTQADSALLADLCARHPIRLLTPRLNIDLYGFQGPTLRSWGAFLPDGVTMIGLLFRLNNTMIAVDAEGACSAAFTAIIDAETGVAGIRGSVEVVSGIQAGLKRYTPTDWEDSYFLRLMRPPACPPETLALARRASMDDLDKLAALYAEAGTMYRSRANVATKLVETRVYVVEEPALGRRPVRIASCALLSPEGYDAGLIGGVFTLPAARGKGYAAAVVSALSLALQNDGKLSCLFYENPIAGRVYRRLGFEEYDRWAVLYLAPRQDRR